MSVILGPVSDFSNFKSDGKERKTLEYLITFASRNCALFDL